ncbi:MAG: 23S rRNA pseudouridine(2604) synthase RluF [Bacteroidota bacterium]
MQKKSGTRLNKFISESGLCSRREADRLIEKGVVTINGNPANIGDVVYAGNRVVVGGKKLEAKRDDKLVFIALNKPVGVTSTTEAAVRDNIVNFVRHTERVFPIGRLDKDSQGLIFLTNDGDVVNKILRAGNKHEKEYIVTVNKPLTEDVIEKMGSGVPMLGVVTKKCKIVQESPTTFRITLIQGLNRQIRRMCEHFAYEVKKLERVRIMNISLGKLPVGDWRDLTEQELDIIYGMIEESLSDDKKGVKKSAQSSAAAKKQTPPKNEDKRKRSEKFKPKGSKAGAGKSGSYARKGPSKGKSPGRSGRGR